MSTTLVLGGARSGKSRYAEQLAHGEMLYIATSEVTDNEMQKRIAEHVARRGDEWRTLEVPLDLAAAVRDQGRKGRFILVDCLTVWIGNLMHHGREVLPEVERLAEVMRSVPGDVVLVSNEVGQGIVPDNAMARAFRDHQGRCNQVMAAVCGTVVLVIAGIPLSVKSPAPR